jgi:DNA polymerase type B, organellar and viral
VKPLIHSGQFISIEAKYKGTKLIFRDSYQHLLASLDKLANNFGVENKGIFPYFLTDLDYKGAFPEYKYFDGNKVSLDLYKKVKKEFTKKNKIWNFKEESIKYCLQDCKSLHQVICKYNELFFSSFCFNIHKYPTLPSLAFANYRANFMKEENIANITGNVYKEIKLGYTGGSNDIFIPKPSEAKKIYAYDVNALYPFVMLNKEYPIGNPTYFKGDIFILSKKPFGFFYCKIIAPDNLLHPILQIHYKTKEGIRTISPLGKFEGMFFSEELYNAEKYGYKFEILWGYTFEKANIFKDYVDTIYNLRLKYPKSDPMNLILKLLLNALYGRFGLDDNYGIIIITEKDNIYKYEDVKDIIDIGSHFIIKYKDYLDKIDSLLNENEIHNVNIAIASAVTAYARIHMSQFKNNPNFNLYYSDTVTHSLCPPPLPRGGGGQAVTVTVTVSIYTDAPLPDSFISNTHSLCCPKDKGKL